MKIKSEKRFYGGMNKDDNAAFLPDGDYSDMLNARTGSSDEQKGAGPAETLQSEIEILINPSTSITYYGSAIGGEFLYSGFDVVQIGLQTWMRRNYDKDYPGSKVYNDDEDNRAIYGGLYTYYQAMSEDFCPAGFRVPTEADFDTLLTYLGGLMIAGGRLKEVGDERWTPPNTGATDSNGFRAVPGGKFDLLFELLGSKSLMWIADDAAPLPPVAINATLILSDEFTANWLASDGADGYKIDVSTSAVFASFVAGYEDLDVGDVLLLAVTGLAEGTPYYYRIRAYNEIGESDNSNVITLTTLEVPALTELVDLDDNVYIPIPFGNQEWLQNLKVTKYADGSAIPNLITAAQWIGETAAVEAGTPINPNTTDTTGVGTATWLQGQTFSMSEIGFVTQVTMIDNVYNTRVGLPNFNIRCSLYNTAAGVPTTLIEDSENVIAASVWGDEDHIFTFADTELAIGDYALVFSYEDVVLKDASNYIKFGIGSFDIGFSGVSVYNTGANWLTHNGSSKAFQLDYNIHTTILVPSAGYCWYNNNIANKALYGALYNWLAIDNVLGLALFKIAGVTQPGWRVATRSDYVTLILNLLGAYVAGGKLKEVGTVHWTAPNTGAIDSIGFTALPAGRRDAFTGAFELINEALFLWTASEESDDNATAVSMLFDSAIAMILGGGGIDKGYGCSVRCMRDTGQVPGFLEFTIEGESKGAGTFRIIVRNNQLCWDEALTSTGFDGIEGPDWINLKAIP